MQTPRASGGTEETGMLYSTGSQRVGCDLGAEQQQQPWLLMSNTGGREEERKLIVHLNV